MREHAGPGRLFRTPSGRASAAASSASSGVSSSTIGLLQRHLYGVGGPAPGTRQAWSGTITVTGSGGRRDVTAGADGASLVALTPGRYTLVGHSPWFGGGQGVCAASTDAEIVAGTTTTTDTYCQMR